VDYVFAVRPHSALGYRPPAPKAWSRRATKARIGALRPAPVIDQLYSYVVPSQGACQQEATEEANIVLNYRGINIDDQTFEN
jgi:hypothetical protein